MASSGGNVLVVEDSATLRSFVVAVLEEEGLAVSVAKNGMEALKRLAHSKFSLIIVDLYMPDVSGSEVVKFSRSDKSANHGTPILVLSSQGGDAERARAMSLGATDSVTKPFQPESILAAVRRCLR